MGNFLKDQWIRVLYAVVSIIIVLIALRSEQVVVSDQVVLNKISYYGTIATIVALIITILEVAQSIRIFSGIQNEARKLLTQVQSIDNATFSSECLSALDDANEYISEEKFFLALKCFQYFRKTVARFSRDYFAEADVVALLNKAEMALQKATHATASAPLTKRAKTSIQSDILTIKEHIEKAALLRKDVHVSAQD